MGIFDSGEEHPPAKVRRYIITVVAFIVVVFLFAWYWMGVRFYKERGTVRHFLTEVATGNTDEAYRIWKPSPTYSLKDFLDDWGSSGYYGPIKSFRVGTPQGVKNGPSVAIVIEVSPDEPFPGDHDEAKQNKTQKITLWVDRADESISFPPY